MKLETIGERRERMLAENNRRTAGERRRNFWAGKAEQAMAGDRRTAGADRRAEERSKAADSLAVADWLARYEAARARLMA